MKRNSRKRRVAHLERRVAHLERQAGNSRGIAILGSLKKEVSNKVSSLRREKRDDQYINREVWGVLRRYYFKLMRLILDKINYQLSSIAEKTEKERLVLNLLAPDCFNLNKMFEEIRETDHKVWTDKELFYRFDRFAKGVLNGRYTGRIESMTERFVEFAIGECRKLGI